MPQSGFILNGALTSQWKLVGTSEMLDRLKSTVIVSSIEHIPNCRLDGSERLGVGNIARIGIRNDPSPVSISIESENTLFSNGLNVTGSVWEVPEPNTIG